MLQLGGLLKDIREILPEMLKFHRVRQHKHKYICWPRFENSKLIV